MLHLSLFWFEKIAKIYVKIYRSGKNCLETLIASFQCVIDITVGILCMQCTRTYSELVTWLQWGRIGANQGTGKPPLILTLILHSRLIYYKLSAVHKISQENHFMYSNLHDSFLFFKVCLAHCQKILSVFFKSARQTALTSPQELTITTAPPPPTPLRPGTAYTQ